MSDYMVITEGSAEAMSVTVTSLLLGGWRPFGGVSVACYRTHDEMGGGMEFIFAQAMVREG